MPVGNATGVPVDGRPFAVVGGMMSAPPDVNPASAASRSSYQATPVIRTEHGESTFTRMVEHQTARIPSDVFLFASICAMAVAFGAEIKGQQRLSRFVGMWAGPLLVMGVYNKLVKTFGPQ